MIIRTRAFPRAAVIGNPSDGYHGKTIAFVFSNYSAEVTLYESPELDLLPSLRDHSTFESVDQLCDEVVKYGYYGGIRLLKASIRKFRDYCLEKGIKMDKRNFTLRYNTDIPNRLGLAGSSAIITGCMRALALFYGVEIAPAWLANLILSVEREELGIPAGLQDRVAQAFNEPVYMDFDKRYMDEHGIGRYRVIHIPKEIRFFVAFRTDLAEGSEILHSHLREDYEAGVPQVLEAMKEWASLTDQAMEAMEKRQYEKLPALLNRNFDLRCEVCGNSVSAKNRRMIELARSVGAPAKLTGSGGAMIGIYEDDAMFGRLQRLLSKNHVEIIKPKIVTDPGMAYG
ncbi:MAG: GHMP kinase [Lentisphaerae bacterium]|nr:GHMP kinase [Lentisphaerota bacterium]